MKIWMYRLSISIVLLLALFLAAFFILWHQAGQVRSSGLPLPHQLRVYGGITRDQLKETEILCSGHFGTAHGQSTTTDTVDMTIGDYTYKGVRRTMCPFTVDHYWMGRGPAILNVAQFDAPPLMGINFSTSAPENKIRYLLLLKKDIAGSSGYQLVDIMNSWLILPDSALEGTTATAPDKVIEAGCVDALDSYADYQPASTQPGNSSEPTDSLQMLYQALYTLKNFGTNDANTLQALEAIFTNPKLQLENFVPHNQALDDLMKIAPAQTLQFGLKLFDAGSLSQRDRADVIAALFQQDPMQGYHLALKLDQAGTLTPGDRLLFARHLGHAITSETYSQLNPGFIEKMIDGDDGAEHQVCDAFAKMRGDPRAIPWLGKFLESDDPDIQFRAMESLRAYLRKAGDIHGFGKDNEDFPRPDSRQIHLHYDFKHHHGQAYPEEVVGPYKAWVTAWIEQHPEYAIPPR